jgi:hypothetical protein
MPIPIIAMMIGGLLITLGVVGYAAPDLIAGGPSGAKTALIPAGLGFLIDLCGAISLAMPNARKHAMHFAAMLGLFGAIGGFMPMMKRNFNFAETATIIGAAMTVLCAIFVMLCVNSFINARKAREAAAHEASVNS